MGKSNIILPRQPLFHTQPEKTWQSWHNNGGSYVTHHPGIQVIASHASGTPEVHMIFGPLPDPLPSGTLTFELAMITGVATSTYIQYNPRWTCVGDNDPSDQAVSSEFTQNGPNFSGYSADDYVIDTHILNADTVNAGEYLLMQLDLIGHASWPADIVTLMPSIYWA